MSAARARAAVLGAALLAIVSDRGHAATGGTPPAEALLSHLTGRWVMRGTVRGEPVTYTLTAARTLQGRFVELHMCDVQRPSRYEARVFVGRDAATDKLIAHWMDSFGAGFSIPPATGEARDDTLELLFPYPDGPFRDRFVYDSARDAWDFHLEAGDSTGGWSTFARYAVRRAAARR